MGFAKKRLYGYFREISGMMCTYIQCGDQKIRKEIWRQLRTALDIGVHLGILKDYPWEGFPDDKTYGCDNVHGPWKIKELLDELNGYRDDVLYGGYCHYPDEYYNRWVYPIHKSLIHTEICANLTSSAKKSLGVPEKDNEKEKEVDTGRIGEIAREAMSVLQDKAKVGDLVGS